MISGYDYDYDYVYIYIYESLVRATATERCRRAVSVGETIQSPSGSKRNHPEPAMQQQQALEFKGVAPSEIIPVEIVPWQTPPTHPRPLHHRPMGCFRHLRWGLTPAALHRLLPPASNWTLVSAADRSLGEHPIGSFCRHPTPCPSKNPSGWHTACGGCRHTILQQRSHSF